MNNNTNDCPTFPYFGAKYPDATCIDGILYDMDKCDDEGNLYELDDYNPCPFCNREEFIKIWTDGGRSEESVNKFLENLDRHKHKGHILFNEM